jgi:hypothetical protein
VVVPDDALNPYAPPTEEVSSTDTEGVWRVEGDYLVVREGTVLPRVDLDGRGSGGPLTPMIMKLPVPVDGKGLVTIAFAALPGVGYLLFQSMRGGRISYVWMMVIVVATQFLFRGVKVRTAPAHVFGYISVPAVRRITRRALWRRRLNLAMLVLIGVVFPLMAAYPGTTRRYDRMLEVVKLAGGMVAGTLVILLAVAVWGALDKGWHCPRFRDGWLWIKGFGPGALAGLGSRAVGYVPVPVKRKVFKMRLDRMPVEFWRQVHGRGFFGRLRTWWFFSQTKGRPLEQYAFHWSERTWLTPEEVDPELVAAWRSETADTALADWTLVHGERAASPAGWNEVNEAVFLSTDGSHAAVPAISRVVMDRKLKETRETHFRSFTTDGRTIATGTMEYIGPQVAGFDFALAKGGTAAVAELHIQRTAGEDLVRMDAEEVRRREERELQGRHEAMEAAGIYGPIEEMDFVRP